MIRDHIFRDRNNTDPARVRPVLHRVEAPVARLGIVGLLEAPQHRLQPSCDLRRILWWIGYVVSFIMMTRSRSVDRAEAELPLVWVFLPNVMYMYGTFGDEQEPTKSKVNLTLSSRGSTDTKSLDFNKFTSNSGNLN